MGWTRGWTHRVQHAYTHHGYQRLSMNTVKAIYPGTFDPMTNGHLDLIARGAKIFDHLVVAVLENSQKSPLFSVPERCAMLTAAVKHMPNVSVDSFDGLLVDFVRSQHAQAVLRGIRAISDYEYELQMALMNRRLAPDLEISKRPSNGAVLNDGSLRESPSMAAS